MKVLEEKILKEGVVLPGNILKVASFLNHRLDVDFIMEMGREIARIFSDAHITKILTVETSGIAIAMGAAAAMHLPVVFAKKHKTGSLSGDMYTTVVHSYTHGVDYNIVVSCDFLKKDDKVLIIDDFLAHGQASLALADLVEQAGGKVAGIGAVIAKAFQPGMKKLREPFGINFAHIGESRPPFRNMRSDERIDSDKIYMIADNHEISRAESGIDAAGGVGEKHRPATHPAQYFNGQNHFLPTDAFVIMTAAAPRGNPLAAAPVKDELTGMSCDRRSSETGDVGICNTQNDFIGLKRVAPPRTEQNADIRRSREAFIRKITGGGIEKI